MTTESPNCGRGVVEPVCVRSGRRSPSGDSMSPHGIGRPATITTFEFECATMRQAIAKDLVRQVPRGF